ncbi:MAG: hypothetical protein DRN07_03265 [Thermoplasmata archaeon]|nr:MAG: hypothetical protein DRN07_03265 [Thermoplasmata archaeon]
MGMKNFYKKFCSPHMKREVVAILFGTVILFSASAGFFTIPSSESDGVPASSTVTEKILYVGGTGPGNYSTIQEALNTSQDGDTVFVYEDSSPYYEHIVVRTSITLVGEERNTTIIDGSGNGTVVHLLSDDIVFSNFTVRNGGRNWSDALVFCDGAGVVVSDVLAEGGHYGFFVDASRCVVKRNQMIDCYTGAYIAKGENNVVAANTMVDQWGRCIAVENAAINTTVRENRFKSLELGPASLGGRYTVFDCNTVEGGDNSIYEGISLSGEHMVVSNNTFIRCGLADFYDYVSCTVYNNTVNGRPLVYMEGESNRLVEDAGQVFLVNCSHITVNVQNMNRVSTGIFLFNSHECTISSSSIFSTWAGMRLFMSTNNVISGNIILSAEYAGIDLAPFSDGNVVSHNTIDDNTRGVYVWSDYNDIHSNNMDSNSLGINLDYGSENNTIRNNTIGNNSIGVLMWQESGNNSIEDNKIAYNDVGVELVYNCPENAIVGNTISHNTRGISMSSSNDNTRIEGNIISENMWGIRVGSKYNVITGNEFLGNTVKDATFFYNGGPTFNNWNGNFWGRPHLLPKPIFGWRIPFIWINFDWRPLLKQPTH